MSCLDRGELEDYLQTVEKENQQLKERLEIVRFTADQLRELVEKLLEELKCPKRHG